MFHELVLKKAETDLEGLAYFKLFSLFTAVSVTWFYFGFSTRRKIYA